MFYTKAGLAFPGVTRSKSEELRRELYSEFGITPTQIAEAASYSMAMVVRFALGLSAQGGRVCALFRDCLGGYIALATARHLVNAGCDATLIFTGDDSNPSSELQAQLKTLDRMGLTCTIWNSSGQNEAITELLGECHNCIVGLFDPSKEADPFDSNITDVINEVSTPLYAVEAPLGVDVDSGVSNNPVFASCTLSLGIPYVGLHPGHEYVGRHYLCDISLTRELYKKVELNLAPVFAEQPVQQIFPLIEKVEDEE